MTNEQDERKELDRWVIMAFVLAVVGGLLLAFSPEWCPEKDPDQMIRRGAWLLVGTIMCCISIPGMYKAFDWVFDGSPSDEIKKGNMAMAVVIASLFGSLAYCLGSM